MRIEKVAVANFRGFCEERQISIPADVVIVRGPNGSGKTSLLDAIQWLLLGDVQRLRLGALRPAEDYLSNRYASGPPFVEANLLGPSGEGVRVTRRGLGKSMQVQVNVGEEPPRIGDEAQRWLNTAMGSGTHDQGEIDFLRRYLLQQDDMREFLGADTKERYKFIATLSGMERLTSLEGQLRDELNAARKRVRELRDDASKVTSELEVVRSSVIRAREVAVSHEEPPGAMGAAARARELLGDRADDALAASRERSAAIGAAVERLDDLRRREASARAELRNQGANEIVKVAETEAEIKKAKEADKGMARELTVLESALADAHTAADRAQQLAALALEQIDGPCPVCLQEHDVEQTQAHLQHLLEGSPGLADLTGAVERKRSERGELERRLARLEAEVNVLRSAVERRRQIEDLLAGINERVLGEQNSLVSLLPPSIETKGDLLGAAEAAQRELKQLATDLQRAAETEARSRQSRKRVEIVEQQQVTSEERRHRLSSALSEAEAKAERAREARSALGLKITEVMREISNASTGLINAIYSRLDIHPTFREFGFRTERYNEVGHLRPWIYDPRRKKEGNALHVLSAAQLNSLAICLFLALNLERDSELRTAILDDPVQSLDDVNLLSLADVLRTVRDRRQVIVSTHDEVLAELLIRKLRPLRDGNATAVVTINQWGENGPQVTSEMRNASGLEPEFQLLATTA